MKLPVYSREGKPANSEVELDVDVFGIEPNDHAIYLAVKTQLTRMRQGTHATKNRAKVSGGGRKPWRQKGRGMARAGTTRSPLWRHGGTIFGPHPFKHTMRLPLKVNRLARASVLASRAGEEAIRLVEDFTFDSPKTKDVRAMINSFDLAGEKVLILTKEYDANLVKSVHNLDKCSVRVAKEASTVDLLNHRVLLIQVGALEAISEVLGGRKRASEKAA
jgi:large subunit ribosomal protein L4